MAIDYNEFKHYNINAKNEKELETQLAIILTKNGWIVERQISSNNKGTNGRPLYRSDLIIYHPKYKELGPIGIELKYIKQVRCGGKLGKHLLQILKYRDCYFKGRKIKTWVLGIYFEDRKHSTMNDYEAFNAIMNSRIYTQGLFNEFGFGFLNLNQPVNKLRIEYSNNDAEKKISIKTESTKQTSSYGDEWFDHVWIPNQLKILKWVNDHRIVKVIK